MTWSAEDENAREGKMREEEIPRLGHYEVALIKGMLARGDRQSDIAAFFSVNGGRIAEINTHQKWEDVRAAPAAELPPPGPYLTPRERWARGEAA